MDSTIHTSNSPRVRRKSNIVFAVALIAFAPLLVSSQFNGEPKSFYSLVASKILRPNSDYLVAVSTQNTEEPTFVVVEISGNQDSGGSFKTTDSVSVEPSSTRILRLEINDIGSGSYTLTVIGSGGSNFQNSTELEYVSKSNSVFVQTDKAIYKPGDKVMFRILVLNPTLRPVSTTFLDIHFTDGRGNRIKEWRKQSTLHGVFSSELQLSEQPVLGNWNITINIGDQEFHNNFEVAEYVLPKFEVKVNVPQHTSFKDDRLVAVVSAKYTYGQSVKGEVTVSVNPNIYSGVIQPFLTNPVYKVVPINGKASVEFDIAKDLKVSDDYERVVQFDVVVEESLTGRRQNISVQTLLHRHRYKLEVIKTKQYFKPGLKYTTRIKLVYHDGTPVTDEKNYVRVKQFYSYSEDEYSESKHKLSSEGIVELHYTPPLLNATVLRIEVEYLDLKEGLPRIAAALSPSNTFIQASLKTKDPAINQLLEIEITCTKPVEFVNYDIFARGGIITANTFIMPRNSTVGLIKVMATQTMAPVAHFIVHFVNDIGEVIADELEIEMKEILQNYVEVKSDKLEYEPGAKAEITFQTKPHSFIGVLGVDQSVLLLKSGNDITHETIYNELKSYDEAATSSFVSRDVNDEKTLSLLPSSFTTEQAFSKSGALVLTNAYVHEQHPWIYYRNNLLDEVDSYANTESVSSSTTSSSLKIRSRFSETWIWNITNTGYDGKAVIRQEIPDTITSWIISAFSIDNINGLGLLNEPLKVKIFKSFFISCDLPYSVQRGEVLAIPVIVFNYLNSDSTVDITLENFGEFEFADYSNDIESPPPAVELYRRRKLTVNAGTGKSTTFVIRPVMLGYISIKLSAKSRIAGDAIEKKLLVKPEGQTIYKNKAMFVDLRNQPEIEKHVALEIPTNIISGSEYIEVSIVGDLIGSSINNIGYLLRMPYGCGEQNMLNFVPNVVILEYLKNTRRLTPSIETKATKFLESGYQQELTFRRSDGSFSAFGSSDPNGSTWLTAFVVKSFRQASAFINVEESVIVDALQWLVSQQASNGSFPEVGKVFYADMQGGSTYEMALTAYTLIAFLEDAKNTVQFRNTVTRSIEYIVRNLYRATDDPYALSLISYALHLAEHPEKQAAFNALESLVQGNDEYKYWKKKEIDLDKNPWTKQPNSVNVEMTSYALLNYIRRRLYDDALPVVNWIVSQQNDQGGFASTQDTVVAIGALAELAKVMSNRLSLSVNVTTEESSRKFAVTEENKLTFQKYELHNSIRNVNFTISGTGFCIIQVAYRYNVNVTGEWPLFILDPQLTRASKKHHMQLSVCTSFVGGNNSNMAVMEVNLPSGFTADVDSLPSLLLSNNVKKVETKNGETQVVLYFDHMTREEICPTVSAYRIHRVANQKPVPIVEYDYYDQTRKSRAFYEVPTTSVCDICEDSDCSGICDAKVKYQKNDEDNLAIRATVMPQIFIFNVIFILISKHLL